MTTLDATIDLRPFYVPQHSATVPPPDFDWSRVARPLSLTLLAFGVYGSWAWVAGPFLIDLIGLWPTRAVSVALIAATMLWRR